MRTSKETASYMIKRYGKDAAVHCTYIIMDNRENKSALAYWTAVLDCIYRQEENEPQRGSPVR
jgi:hypothetical protein